MKNILSAVNLRLADINIFYIAYNYSFIWSLKPYNYSPDLPSCLFRLVMIKVTND